MRTLTISTTVLLVAALAVGCGDNSSPTAPTAIDTAALSGLGGPSADGTVSEGTIIDFPGSAPDGIAGGSGILTRTAAAIEIDINATNLVAGDAYTLWWIIFEKPQFCVDGCGGPDLGNPLVQGSVLYAAGGVADGAGDATFTARLLRHDTGDAFVILGDGVDNTLKAEVHIVFKSHGLAEVDAANLVVQTSTPGGFCNLAQTTVPPQGPLGCKDVGAIVFPLP